PDADYIRFPLPPGGQAYADVDAMKIKATIGEITAISRKSRDDGNQYWGRIPSTPYDRMTEDWVMSQFTKLGLKDVHRQEIAMKPLWFPTSWSAELIADGKELCGPRCRKPQRLHRDFLSVHILEPELGELRHH